MAKEVAMVTAPDSMLLFWCILGFSLVLPLLFIASAIRIVPENVRLAVFRLGRYLSDKGPGVVFLIPIIDRAIRVDANDQVQWAQAQQQMWGVIGETQTPVHEEGGHVEVSG
jgi:regulator of protease activity HflC (stomatin/prohibitin superfamily)